MTRARVLLLGTGEAVDEVRLAHGSFRALFEAGLGLRVDYLDATARAEGDPLPALDELDGMVVTGSASMVGDDTPWMRWCVRAIQAALEREVAFLGVCFGHQLLGVACGAEVGPNPLGRKMGSSLCELEGPGALFDDAEPFYAQVAHRDVIHDPGPALEVIGRAPHDACHVVRAGPRAWGVQFHPEFDRRVSAHYVRARARVLDDEGGAGAAERALSTVRETPVATRVLARFAAQCAATEGPR